MATLPPHGRAGPGRGSGRGPEGLGLWQPGALQSHAGHSRDTRGRSRPPPGHSTSISAREPHPATGTPSGHNHPIPAQPPHPATGTLSRHSHPIPPQEPHPGTGAPSRHSRPGPCPGRGAGAERRQCQRGCGLILPPRGKRGTKFMCRETGKERVCVQRERARIRVIAEGN